MLADRAAVAVFKFAPQAGGAGQIIAFRQVNGFFKSVFLLSAVQASSGFIGLIVHSAAQVAAALPAAVSYAVLHDNGFQQALYNFEHCGQVIRNQNLGFNRQLLPGFPAASIGKGLAGFNGKLLVGGFALHGGIPLSLPRYGESF